MACWLGAAVLVAVMVAVPRARAVITPEPSSIDAIVGALLLHFTVSSTPPMAVTVALRVCVAPTVNENEEGMIVTLRIPLTVT